MLSAKSKVNWNIELNWASNASVQGKNSCTGSKQRRTDAHAISGLANQLTKKIRYPSAFEFRFFVSNRTMQHQPQRGTEPAQAHPQLALVFHRKLHKGYKGMSFVTRGNPICFRVPTWSLYLVFKEIFVSDFYGIDALLKKLPPGQWSWISAQCRDILK